MGFIISKNQTIQFISLLKSQNTKFQLYNVYITTSMSNLGCLTVIFAAHNHTFRWLGCLY